MDSMTLNPPGKAVVTRCGACSGAGVDGSSRCRDCDGTGKMLYRACPRCGDIGFDKMPDGTFACRISCGYRWTAEDPGWVIQYLPS
jgi:hypothetical protein